MQIAQVNIAQMKAPLEDPIMKEFVDFLAPINQLADDSPGFVWRLKDETGESAVSISSPFDNDMLIINMSVWKDVNSLKNFIYHTAHSYFVRSGRKWFDKLSQPNMALWWVTDGHEPTLEEAKEKLELLESIGPSADSFNFKEIFNPTIS